LVKLLAFCLLALIPSFYTIYFRTEYYIFISLLIVVGLCLQLTKQQNEEIFYKRWGKIRENKYVFNILREGFLKLVFVVIMIFSILMFFRGYTPVMVINKLSLIQVSLIFLILAVGSLGLGAFAYHDKEKRFLRIKLKIPKL